MNVAEGDSSALYLNYSEHRCSWNTLHFTRLAWNRFITCYWSELVIWANLIAKCLKSWTFFFFFFLKRTWNILWPDYLTHNISHSGFCRVESPDPKRGFNLKLSQETLQVFHWMLSGPVGGLVPRNSQVWREFTVLPE